jgi:hypothetical protein
VKLFAKNGTTYSKSNYISICPKMESKEVLDVTFIVGMLLNGVKLFLNKIIIYIMQTWEPDQGISEISCRILD